MANIIETNNILQKIPQLIQSYFQKEFIDSRLKKYKLFVIRYDGVVLYLNNQDKNNASIGALVGGVWQASKALVDFFPNKTVGSEVYRLSFDTSASGVYVLPLNIAEKEENLFLGLIYSEELNPGLIKNILRELGLSLGKYLNREIEKSEVTKNNKSRTDFLFGEISDSEMDHLFSQAKS